MQRDDDSANILRRTASIFVEPFPSTPLLIAPSMLSLGTLFALALLMAAARRISEVSPLAWREASVSSTASLVKRTARLARGEREGGREGGR